MYFARVITGMFSCCDVKHLAEESQIMARFDHPNVMKLIGVSMNKYKHLFIVMPFMAKGSLLYHLKKNRHIFTIESEEITEMVIVPTKLSYIFELLQTLH